jgi:dienelactone hydrolase
VLPESGPDNNFGGVSGSTPAEENAVRAVRQVMAEYRVDRSQVLATGGSMGGLGTWQLAIDCNSQNGTLSVDGQPCRQFTAFMPIDGGMNNLGGNLVPEQLIADQLKDVPIYAIHGTQDSQVPTQFDTDMRQLMAGNPTFKSAAPDAGHGTWNQYYQNPTTWKWLFSQGGNTVQAAAPPTSSVTGHTAPVLSPAVPASASTTATPTSSQPSSAGSNTPDDRGLPEDTAPAPQSSRIAAPIVVSAIPRVSSRLICGASTGTGTGQFQVLDGHIIDPRGNVFVAHGLNADVSVDPNAILAKFAGVNLVRLALGHRLPASDISSFISTLTSHGVVVEIEDHPWPLVDAYSGPALAAETNWYASLAGTFRGNPYVWFGTMNEPQGGNIPGQQAAIYAAIRGAGNNTIIMMEAGHGGGDPGQVGPTALSASTYAGMHNVAWDLHIYGWITRGSTDQGQMDGMILGTSQAATGISAALQITSADGVIPVVIGEFGPTAAGYSSNGDQVINGVVDAVNNGYAQGFVGWEWNPGDDDALVVNGSLTRWGQILRMAIAKNCKVESAAVEDTGAYLQQGDRAPGAELQSSEKALPPNAPPSMATVVAVTSAPAPETAASPAVPAPAPVASMAQEAAYQAGYSDAVERIGTGSESVENYARQRMGK